MENKIKDLIHQKQLIEEQLSTNLWQAEYFTASKATVAANRKILEMNLKAVENELNSLMPYPEEGQTTSE